MKIKNNKTSEAIELVIDLSQLKKKDLAKKAKILQSSISHYLNDDHHLTLEKLDKIAQSVGLEVEIDIHKK